MKKKYGVGSGVGGVGGVCNQRDSFSVAMQKKDYPHVSATDADIERCPPSGSHTAVCRLSYTKIRKTKRPMRWDWLSHPLGQPVPTGGTIIVSVASYIWH